MSYVYIYIHIIYYIYINIFTDIKGSVPGTHLQFSSFFFVVVAVVFAVPTLSRTSSTITVVLRVPVLQLCGGCVWGGECHGWEGLLVMWNVELRKGWKIRPGRIDLKNVRLHVSFTCN